MPTIIQNTYAGFLQFLFQRKESQGEWRFDDSLQEPALSPAQLVQCIIRMFENYETDIAHYSDWQIAKGVGYLFNSSFSDWVFVLREGPGLLPERLKAIHGLKSFYQRCLEKRCAPTLGHYSEPGNPLNYFCYMLWDFTSIACFEGVEDKDLLNQAVVDVMEYALTLDNKACVESGLHGLGHLTLFYPKASTIIERNTGRFEKIDPRLLTYAQAAKTGYIQ